MHTTLPLINYSLVFTFLNIKGIKILSISIVMTAIVFTMMRFSKYERTINNVVDDNAKLQKSITRDYNH